MDRWERILQPYWVNHRWVRAISVIRFLSGILVIFIGILAIFDWSYPVIAEMFHRDIIPMKSSTSVSVILLTVAVLLFPSLTAVRWLLSGLSVSLAVVFGFVPLFLTSLGSESSQLLTVLERMSIQGSIWVTVMALLQFISNIHRLRLLTSLLTLSMIGYSIVLFVAQLFRSFEIVGESNEAGISLQTSIALTLLTLAWVSTWISQGAWHDVLEDSFASLSLRMIIIGIIVLTIITAIGWNYLISRDIDFAVSSAIAVAFLMISGLGGAILLYGRMKQLETEVHKYVLRDFTTGLLNQDSFMQYGPQFYRNNRIDGNCVAIMFDLDGLKKINDTYGHEAGTQMIASFGHCLDTTTKSTDFVARIGGDEFVVLQPHSDLSTVDSFLHDLQECASQAKEDLAGHYLEYSYGIAEPMSGDAFESLIHRADKAMYAHKRTRKSES